jgi:hypothetical protein
MRSGKLLAALLIALGLLAATGCADPMKFFFPWLPESDGGDDSPDADPTRSTVAVDRTTGVLADDEDFVTVTVTVRDKKGRPIEGKRVEIAVTGSGNTIAQPAAKTSGAGVATATIRSRFAGAKTITATVAGDGALATKPTVTFDRPDGFAHAESAGSDEADEATGVAALADGGYVVVGRFRGMASFGGGFSVASAGGDDVFVARYDWTGSCVYASAAGGIGNDVARAVAALPDGSVVVTGSFDGPAGATFGRGESNRKTLSGVGREVFVARFRADGTLAWALDAGGTGDDEAFDVAAIEDGRATVVGGFENTAVFASGKSVSSAGGKDAFVARYEADGNVAWVARAGSATADEAAVAVAAFGDGAALVGGAFSAGFTLGGRALAPAGAQDIFLARYDARGNVIQAQSAGGKGADVPGDLAGRSDGSAVLVGTFEVEATFGDGAHAKDLQSTSPTEIFLAAFDENGDLLFATPGAGSDAGAFQALSIAALADGSVVVVGGVAGTAELGSGGTLEANGLADAFVAEWDEAGALVWARRVGGTGEDRANAVAAIGDGGFAAAGRFAGTAVFGEGEPREEALSSGSPGDFDAFSAKYYPYGP